MFNSINPDYLSGASSDMGGPGSGDSGGGNPYRSFASQNPPMNLGMSPPPQNQQAVQPAWAGGNPFLGTSNPYLQQNIDNTMGDMTRGYNMMTKPNIESAMVGSGSFGNSGLQQQQNYQQSQLTDSMGKTAAGMRLNDYNQQQNMYQWDQGYNRNLFNDANQQNHQNLVDTMGLLGQANQFNQQDIANTTNVQNTPMNYAQQFSNMANSVANGFANTTSSTPMNTSPLTGALGGWQLGNAYAQNAAKQGG